MLLSLAIFSTISSVAFTSSTTNLPLYLYVSSPVNEINGLPVLTNGTDFYAMALNGAVSPDEWQIDSQGILSTTKSVASQHYYLGSNNDALYYVFGDSTQGIPFNYRHYKSSDFLEIKANGPTVSGTSFHLVYQTPTQYILSISNSNNHFGNNDHLVNLRLDWYPG